MLRTWRMLSPLLAILLCVLATSTSAMAQQGRRYTITGTVTRTDNSPLSGAQVSIRGTQQGSLTNEQGRYTIEAALPAGSSGSGPLGPVRSSASGPTPT